MKCEICGGKYVRSCTRCTKRVATWGEHGTLALIDLAKQDGPIDSQEIVKFVDKYYIGKARTRSDKACVFRKALEILGYSGGYIGRIHKNNKSYGHLRLREHGAARRYRLKKEFCEICGADGELYLHHVVPLSWGGKSSDDNCITLCDKHHKVIHKRLNAVLNRSKLLDYLKPHKDEIERLAKLSLPE